ncbi:MAG: hypothetical protein Q3962_07815 [Corynebacterium sp.]|nr:hypothetical protein [Corynebacterium sp.]
MNVILLIMALISIWACWKLAKAQRGVTAFLLVALSIVLSAPVAVTHHWACVIIFVPMLFMLRDRILSYGLGLMAVGLVLTGINNHGGFVLELAGTEIYHNTWAILRAQCIYGLVMYALLLVSVFRIDPKSHKNEVLEA